MQGTCRDGVPHGPYSLKGTDGTARVIGAYNRGKRTGSFIFWNSAGVRIAHIPFDDDAISGTVAMWYAAPVRDGATPQKLEAAYSMGRRNGMTRHWYADGLLRAQYTYVDGALTEALAWDVRGAPLSAQDAEALAARDAQDEAGQYKAFGDLVRRNPPTCRAAGGGRLPA